MLQQELMFVAPSGLLYVLLRGPGFLKGALAGAAAVVLPKDTA